MPGSRTHRPWARLQRDAAARHEVLMTLLDEQKSKVLALASDHGQVALVRVVQAVLAIPVTKLVLQAWLQRQPEYPGLVSEKRRQHTERVNAMRGHKSQAVVQAEPQGRYPCETLATLLPVRPSIREETLQKVQAWQGLSLRHVMPFWDIEAAWLWKCTADLISDEGG
jgi:hypothetical protein